MKLQMRYVGLNGGDPQTVWAWDREEIERKVRNLAHEISWAEVHNEEGRLVAKKEAGSARLQGMPGAFGWGPVCAACFELSGQDRHTPPHPSLERKSSTRYHGGMALGTIVNYECRACHAGLQLDNDRKDPGAGWGFHSWPTWLPGAIDLPVRF